MATIYPLTLTRVKDIIKSLKWDIGTVKVTRSQTQNSIGQKQNLWKEVLYESKDTHIIRGNLRLTVKRVIVSRFSNMDRKATYTKKVINS